MSLTSLMNRAGTITSRTAGTAVDVYGNATPDESSTAVLCEIQQIRREEPGEAGEFSVAEWVAYLPTGTAIDTGDALVVDDITFEVIGQPWDANSGSSAVHHVEATLRRTAE